MADINYGGTAEQDTDTGEARPPKGDATIEKLTKFAESDNVAELLTADELDTIGERVNREYLIDKATQQDWDDDNEEAMKLALQVAEEKSYPWPGAANVKYPLITSASIQFAARAYPAILGKGDPVKSKVIGRDESGEKRERGDRVGRHMSWQLTEEMEEWEEDTDKLLHVLPIAGMVYRKTYFAPSLGRNKSELVMGNKLVVNKSAKSFSTVPRATHAFPLYPVEITERQRSEQYLDVDLGLPQEAGDDEDAPHEFLEQHRRLDLDGDGYAEPYIVTIHEETKKVVRILANFDLEEVALNDKGKIAKINPIEYFTKYSFFPNPDGGWHDIGFGYLLRPLNEAVNTTLNQMLDAGHLAVVGGGFIGSGARLKGGKHRFRPGEYKPADVSGGTLKDNIVPLPFPGPNMVLFQLLGLLIDATKDISSVKDVLTGDIQGANQSPTTTLAMIEQGLQVFTAIYKRIYRALRSEYKKLYRLNSMYLDEETYFTVLDEEETVGRADYNTKDFDVIPVADPTVVTSMQKMARAEYLGQFKDDPMLDGKEILRRMFDAVGIDEADQLFVDQMPPNPQLMKDADEIDIKKAGQLLEAIKLEGQLALWEAQGIKAIADAEGVEPGQQIQAYAQLMKGLTDDAKQRTAEAKNATAPAQPGGGAPSPEGPIE